MVGRWFDHGLSAEDQAWTGGRKGWREGGIAANRVTERHPGTVTGRYGWKRRAEMWRRVAHF